MQVKVCKDCKVEKPVSEFVSRKMRYKETVYTCYQPYCKPCDVLRHKVWRHKKKLGRELYNEWNAMKSPISWHTLKSTESLERIKVYPTCSKGHKYIGTHCLMCKYSLQSTARMM